MNQELSGKEAYEARKAERESQRQTAEPAASHDAGKRVVRWTVWIVVIIGLAYGGYAYVKSQAPQGEDFSVQYPSQGQDHIAVGAAHATYNSNPPSSGPHYEEEAIPGFYGVDEALPDEQVIHNLEHGHVWIAYNPSITESVRTTLREYASPTTVISPRAANSADIALIAWGRVDTFNLIDGGIQPELQRRIDDFVKRYTNKGPEKVPSTGEFRK